MTPQQHRQAFLLLLGRLAEDFDRGLDRGDLPARLYDLSCVQMALCVAPEELAALRKSIDALLIPHLPEAPGRNRVTLSLFSLPDD